MFKTGWDWVVANSGHKTYTVNLEDGERVIGFKSRTYPNCPNVALHCDFQLIIGRLV